VPPAPPAPPEDEAAVLLGLRRGADGRDAGALFSVVPRRTPVWCVEPLALEAYRALALRSPRVAARLRSAQLEKDAAHCRFDGASLAVQRARFDALAAAARSDLERRGADEHERRSLALEVLRLERRIDVWDAELASRTQRIADLQHALAADVTRGAVTTINTTSS
jgi:hypothetical protein